MIGKKVQRRAALRLETAVIQLDLLRLAAAAVVLQAADQITHAPVTVARQGASIRKAAHQAIGSDLVSCMAQARLLQHTDRCGAAGPPLAL